MGKLSASKYLTLGVLRMVTASISAIASVSVILTILKGKKLVEVYHRIIFGMSALDLLVDLSFFLQLVFQPKSTGFSLALGTVRTCETVAFLLNFWYGTVIYNTVLSIYFLRMIRYGKKGADRKRFVEPYGHILAIGFPLLVGAVGLATQSFNTFEEDGFCGIYSYPNSCGTPDTADCERGAFAPTLSAIMIVVVTLAVIVAVVCTWLVYWTLRTGNRSSVLSARRRQNKMGAVVWQSILYTTSFVAAFVVAASVDIVGDIGSNNDNAADSSLLFGMLILLNLFVPLQGLFNWFIYMRPLLQKWKTSHPDKSWFWAALQILSLRQDSTSVSSSIGATASGVSHDLESREQTPQM